jgi:biopolymer transport protein ExbD
MRRKRRPGAFTREGDDAEVPMSPLIDCVFLLLIFFLVTSMLRRKEMLIPIKLPDQSAAVADSSVDDTLVIGLDRKGQVFRTLERIGSDGQLLYEPVQNVTLYLQSVLAERGQVLLRQPLRIDSDRDTPFQKAIDVLDTCKLLGFANVGLKTRMRKK